jgi:hypothetical protein
MASIDSEPAMVARGVNLVLVALMPNSCDFAASSDRKNMQGRCNLRPSRISSSDVILCAAGHDYWASVAMEQS